MKILVMGAGKMGSFFIDLLSFDHEVAVFERDAKRMRVCREIGQYKKEHNMTVLQTSRYNEILAKRGAQGSLLGMGPEFVAKVFESIHEESVRQQIEIINK